MPNYAPLDIQMRNDWILRTSYRPFQTPNTDVAHAIFHNIYKPAYCTHRVAVADRHNYHPASYAVDLIFCCLDSSHIWLTQSNHLISPSVFLFFFSQMGPSLESSFRRIVGLVSSRVQITLNIHPFLHLSVTFSTFSVSLVLSFLTLSLTVWPHAHLHIFISVNSCFFTCEPVTVTVSIPYSTAG